MICKKLYLINSALCLVSQSRITEIIKGRRGISADTAVRLGHFFGVDPQNWLNLQTHYDLEDVRLNNLNNIEKEVIPYAA